VFCLLCGGGRERNRQHAKRSRVRKKELIETLQESLTALQVMMMMIMMILDGTAFVIKACLRLILSDCPVIVI
jgi:hypothetical protein